MNISISINFDNKFYLKDFRHLTEQFEKTKFIKLIEIDSIIKQNSEDNINNKDKQNLLKFPVDYKLSKAFNIVGGGTQSLVFDCNTDFVLKRTQDQDRGQWESNLNLTYGDLKAEYYTYVVKDSETYGKFDVFFQIQEKLTPINVKDYEKQIYQLYFNGNENREIYHWEWGVDKNGIPKVLDWG